MAEEEFIVYLLVYVHNYAYASEMLLSDGN